VSKLRHRAKCDSTREIEEQTGVADKTAHDWITARKTNEFANRAPPDSRQHFDVWNYAPVAQRSERAAHNGLVAGSSPARRTNTEPAGAPRRSERPASRHLRAEGP
jgi:hypothetical protein